MPLLRRIAKPVTHFALFGFLALTLHVPTVQAGMIGTDTVVNTSQAQQVRDQVRALLDRDEVRRQLLGNGVNAEQVQARVDALTDSEAQQLAAELDQLPAGGDSFLGLAVFIFLVLLLTDILGYTDIFPFVKKKTAQ